MLLAICELVVYLKKDRHWKLETYSKMCEKSYYSLAFSCIRTRAWGCQRRISKTPWEIWSVHYLEDWTQQLVHPEIWDRRNLIRTEHWLWWSELYSIDGHVVKAAVNHIKKLGLARKMLPNCLTTPIFPCAVITKISLF